MPKETHFYDTINAIKNYDTSTNNYNTYYHTFNVSFPFKFPIINLKSITLKSVEMPIVLTTLRNANNTCAFYIRYTFGGSNSGLTVVLTDRKYYTINSLLSLINTRISMAISGIVGLSIVFSSAEAASGFLCVIDHNCTSIEIEDTPLTRNILGFTIFTDSNYGIDFYAQSPINLFAIDTCIYIKILNLPVMNNNNGNGYTFKVPFNTTEKYNGSTIGNHLIYFNDTTEHQTIFFNDTNFVLNKFDVVVVDRLGALLVGYHNWTFSLILDYKTENNNNEQQFLNINN